MHDGHILFPSVHVRPEVDSAGLVQLPAVEHVQTTGHGAELAVGTGPVQDQGSGSALLFLERGQHVMPLVEGLGHFQAQIIQPVLTHPQAQPGTLLGLTQLVHSAHTAGVGGGQQLILHVGGADGVVVGHILGNQIGQIQEVAVVDSGVHTIGVVGSANIDQVGQVAGSDHQVEVGLIVSVGNGLEFQMHAGALFHLLIELVVVPVIGDDGSVGVVSIEVGQSDRLVHDGQLELAGFGGFAFLGAAFGGGGAGLVGGGAGVSSVAAGSQRQDHGQNQQHSHQFFGVFHFGFLLYRFGCERLLGGTLYGKSADTLLLHIVEKITP